LGSYAEHGSAAEGHRDESTTKGIVRCFSRRSTGMGPDAYTGFEWAKVRVGPAPLCNFGVLCASVVVFF
jgi:hypothetical protein